MTRTGPRPFILGLTGSIGMGKSTVARMLRDLGVPVFDADAEVHRMQGPNGRLLPAIEAAFPGLTGPEGVKRAELGALVFGDSDALSRLEAIVHPAVVAERSDFIDANWHEPLIVFDVPLLFEKTGRAGMDAVVVVSAPADEQRRRVLARPGMTEDKFADILARQMPDGEKRRRADYVIDTGASLDNTGAQVARMVESLQLRPKDDG
ncbi:dephospho-CoA kinase [Croceicoccus ponticola]|uniref:Dephospho-CoA kinase n=1 Tax=Croceicoccus ponticola TaxID=2217664 RepID=A0A437GYE9_9SPHN|nr:dephospho-CoA kinase [Croceicoccus ponticola]RVQ67701.1 dephospho-CoA kinase [Croceicoccus ponticola]